MAPRSPSASPSPASAEPILEATGLVKTHRLGEVEIRALAGVDVTVHPGEMLVISGPSGSGKSTLLQLLGLLDAPDAGRLALEGREVASLGDRERTLLRRRALGFVFQSFNLLPVLTARENVEYPLWIAGVPRGESRRRALDSLAEVGLAERADHRPDRLSGGERQRVAIARALVHGPRLVIADEPTGNLDSATAEVIVGLFERLATERAMAVVLATHDPALIAGARRRLHLTDGREVPVGSAPGNPSEESP